MRRIARLAGLLAFMLATPARAHEAGLSRGEYRVHGAEVVAMLSFARGELAALVPGADADADGVLAEFELLAIDAALRRALVDGVVVRAGDVPCPGAVTRVGFVEEDGLVGEARFTCPVAAPLPAFTLRMPLLPRLGPAHRHLARVQFDARTGPEGQVAGDLPEAIDVVLHARRGALSFRRPDARARQPGDANPVAAAAAAPPVPASPPAAPPVGARALWLTLALVGLVALARRARRNRAS